MKNIHYMWVVLISILYIGINTVWAVDYGTIHAGETRSGNISVPSLSDTFTFYGKSGDGVIITMTVLSGELNPQIDLYDPDGILEKSQAWSPGGSTQISNWQLKKTGIYTIVCSDYGQTDTGKYNLSFDKIPGPASFWKDNDGGVISSGQTKIGNITEPSSADCFRFTALANQTVIITMTVTSGVLNPQIDLYDPDGILEKSQAWSPGGSAQISNWQLKKTGIYTIVCSDYGQTDTGQYNISLTKIPSTSLGLANPMPADGETAAPLTTNLSWDAVPDATGYDVYFGNEEPLARVAENISGTSYDPPGNFESEKTYLWYVMAHRPDGDFRGPMYIFRTLGAPTPVDFACLTPRTDVWVWDKPGEIAEGNPSRWAWLGYTQDFNNGWQTLAGDFFNKDGLLDFACVTQYGSVWACQNNGNSQFINNQWQSGGYICDKAQGWYVFAGDFNGDGRDDLVQLNGKYYEAWVGLNDGTKIPSPIDWGTLGFQYAPQNKYWIGVRDVNGDGRDDLVQLTPYRDAWVALSSGLSFGAPSRWGWLGFKFDLANAWGIHIGDFNGDGKADLCCVTPYTDAWVSLSTGSAFGVPLRWGWLGFSDNPSRGNGWNVFAGDVNGDGNDDLIQLTEYGDIWFAISTGSGFNAPYRAGWPGFRHQPEGPWQVFVGKFK